MAVYAIGDVQGCHQALLALLARVDYRPGADRLWFTGDLVNRGADSAAVLRFAQRVDAINALGNHDLHLLAVASGAVEPKRRDTFHDVLDAPDREVLLAWLRRQPLLHHDATLGYTMVHAGLPPQWDLALAQQLAAEVEAIVRGPAPAEFYRHMYGDQPDAWHTGLTGFERARFISNAFTRLRYCTAAGHLDLHQKGAPGTQPAPLQPWFALPERRNRDLRIVFGHWSTLGVYQGDGVIGLDSGCLWGGALTAVRLDVSPPEFFSVPCPARAK